MGKRILGPTRISGVGSGTAGDDGAERKPEDITASLQESFARLAGNEKVAKIAAAGRR